MSQFYQARLLLCRHGEAAGNLKHAFLGARDDELTQRGYDQAQALAELLLDEPIDHVFSSPLRRASQTAKILAQAKNLPVEFEPLLREQAYGRWEGLNFIETRQQFPDEFAAWMADATQVGPPGGESLKQVETRVASFYNGLELNGERTYALVGHGGCLQALICHIFALPTRAIWPFRLANGSVTELQFCQGQPVMTRLSAYSIPVSGT